jgi:site-specific DNA-methyltransferase (adenine-specific)
MGQVWDGGGVAFEPELWAEALRVVKPGGMLLSFGGTRTFHRLTCAIEDAGWEIRDCLSWIYGSGFPKSKNLDGEFKGWGTALKPAWEPVILAMKPCEGTFAQNAEKHGVSGLNIDGGRIGTGDSSSGREGEDSANRRYTDRGGTSFAMTPGPRGGDSKGRWPANLLLDEESAAQLDEQTGILKSGTLLPSHNVKVSTGWSGGSQADRVKNEFHANSGGASRFFYCAKASKKDRGEGNGHPTVKPTDLMRYLCRLTKTPTGGVVLDPFMGSGSTGVAATLEGRDFIGIEQSTEYYDIACKRIGEVREETP